VIRVALFLALFLPAPTAIGQGQTEAGEPPAADPFEQVLTEVARIHDEPGLRSASLGFAIIPLGGDASDDLAGYQENLCLLPASTLKVVTTATALELLGPAFAFETVLQHTGTITDDGTLAGDLIVKGGGDPTLGSSGIARTHALWANALRQAGIRKIDGRMIGDDALFGTQLRPDDWQWNDLGNYYAAGSSGLNFHRNQFFCRFPTGPEGTLSELAGTDPALPELTFINEIVSGAEGTGDQGYIYGAPYANLLYLRGTLPPDRRDFTIRGALPDPAQFCVHSFSLYLGKNMVEVSGEATTARQLEAARKTIGPRRELLRQKSPPLAQLIATTNMRSDNLHAECLHRILGATRGSAGTSMEASRIVREHWREQGIDLSGFHMTDGCGLARTNTITARQLTLLLHQMATSEHFEVFYKSLPVAGQSGTLRSIGQGEACEGRVHAKSGSIGRVKTFCGYLDARNGSRYAFAILINHYEGDVAAINRMIVGVWNKMIAL
jgi:D-alanyl-D-alanine carboxypeptidase/D-alanyl-D-alanine-endopeptidase (penicillin-binding protein 4)